MTKRTFENRTDLKNFMERYNTSIFKMAADLECNDVYFYQIINGSGKSKRIADGIEKVFGVSIEEVNRAWRNK